MSESYIPDIKAIAFDLDGTLVDSAPGLAEAVNLALASQGLPVANLELVKQWVGNGADVLMSRALLWTGHKPTDSIVSALRQAFDHFYSQTVGRGTVLYPQVVKTLDRLKQSALPLAIVTNKPSRFVPDLLKTLAIEEYFSLIVGGDDVIKRKPHPAAIYFVLSQFGLYSKELLFVGDSRNDIEAAKAAHCPTIGLNYGYNYGESIALSAPTCLLDKFDDILPVIGLVK